MLINLTRNVRCLFSTVRFLKIQGIFKTDFGNKMCLAKRVEADPDGPINESKWVDFMPGAAHASIT